MPNNRFEIADLRPMTAASASRREQRGACAPDGAMRRGWGAQRGCKCDGNVSVLNCLG